VSGGERAGGPFAMHAHQAASMRNQNMGLLLGQATI